jgi:ribose-phosphate pyrophosphokinase
MARSYAKALGADLAIVDKRRLSGSETSIEHVIGQVEGRNVVLVDDMISTGGSITQAALILKQQGANQIIIAVSHAVLCGPACTRLAEAPVDRILVTDTIPRGDDWPDKIETVSVAKLLADTIHNIHHSISVSSLFDDDQN